MTGKTTYLLRICFLDDQTLNKINRTRALFTQFQYIPMEAVKSSVYVVAWMLTSCKHKAVFLPAVKCLPSPTRIHLYLEPSLHWSMPSAILCCCAPFSISISYPPPHPQGARHQGEALPLWQETNSKHTETISRRRGLMRKGEIKRCRCWWLWMEF